ASKSLEELNMSVEPPSPPDEELAEWDRDNTQGDCKPDLTEEQRSLLHEKTNSSVGRETALYNQSTRFCASSLASQLCTEKVIDVTSNNVAKLVSIGPQQTRDVRQELHCQSTDRDFCDKDTMHFGSSDINPFVHQWQQHEYCRVGLKQHSFGSASDVSVCSYQQSFPEKIIRCSSVDNGLNAQQPPFNSHLSSYANTRALSSTLSSIEDLQEWDSIGPSAENAYSYVDEIVLLYPSEAETTVKPSSEAVVKAMHNQGTQTVGETRQRRPNRHRRCYTQTSARPPETETLRERPASWASLDSLSIHLSQLIHNTSEILGSLSQQHTTDIQLNTNLNLSKTCRQSDSCTQTTIDAAVQTEVFDHFQLSSKESEPLPMNRSEKEQLKAQEVNVIVKVLGSNVVEAPQESSDITVVLQDRNKRSDLKKPPFEEISYSIRTSTPSLADLNTVPQGVQQNFLPFIPGVSPVSSPSQISVVTSSSTSVMQLSKLQPQDTVLSQDKQFNSKHNHTNDTKTYSHVVLVDRASSPILTLSAGTGNHIARSKSTHCLIEKDHLDSQDYISISQRSIAVGSTKKRSMANNSLENVSISSEVKGIHTLTCGRCTLVITNQPQTVQTNISVEMEEDIVQQKSYVFVIAQTETKQPVPSLMVRNRYPHITNVQQELSSVDEDSKRTYSAKLYHNNFMVSSSCNQLFSTSGLIGFQNNHQLSSSDISEMTIQLPEGYAASDGASECNTEVLLNETHPVIENQRHQSYSLEDLTCRVPEDLPMHNKFTNWSGVQYRPPSSVSLTSLATDSQMERNTAKNNVETDMKSKIRDERIKEIETLRKERTHIMSTVHLDLNQHQLTVELTEAKLNYGLGETDTLLKVLQSGTMDDSSLVPIKQQLYNRHMKTIENLRKEREERLQAFRRARSLSPQKRMDFSQRQTAAQWELDLPSRRREYLQQLRKDVIENTRIHDPKKRAAQTPSDIEHLLRDYQKAREEAKTEIAKARDKLRERTEQEKRRLQQQMVSQLLKEEAKMKTLRSTSTLGTGSSLSLSSGPTSGYNSSNTAPGGVEWGEVGFNQAGPSSTEQLRSSLRGRTTARKSQLYALEGRVMASRGKSSSERCAPARPFSSISVSYQDIATRTLANVTEEMTVASADNVANLLNGTVTGGWRYQCTEKGVLIYYKQFSSSTKHGFLGVGVIEKPLHSVWCMVKDHSKRHLYDKMVRMAHVHKKMGAGLQLVYFISDTSLCYLKQPRDFCCISVEAKESISLVALLNSMTSVLSGEFAKSLRNSILIARVHAQHFILELQKIGKILNLTLCVDLGAPAVPPRLLGSVTKRQPLVIASLANFLSD
uniref:START domain-containing protein n=1 Tax=Latimeria chalumnae TaxID=7897 RepID=H3AGW9_LATCH